MRTKLLAASAMAALLLPLSLLSVSSVAKPSVDDPRCAWGPPEPATDAGRLLLVKEIPPASASTPWFSDYMRMLERFPRYAERGWQRVEPAEDSSLGYFGGPGHTELAMRPMAQFVMTMALLASDPTYDPRPSGMSAEVVRERALVCLRYLMRTHVTGDMRRPSGEAWGDDPQSPWWIGRLATAGRLLGRWLTATDREALERVVTYEAGRQLARAPTQGGPPEAVTSANAWGAELLAWAAALYPKHAEAERWEEQARVLMMNTLSAPQDRLDADLVDGRPVRDWVTTANLLPEFLATRGGAAHFCYLALPLQSLASAYHAYAGTKRPVPRALFHHLEDAWRAVQQLYLFDGSFAYPAGKEWPRGAYGPAFMLPVLALMQVDGSEPSTARLLERALVRRFEEEQQANADGTFFGTRFTGGAFEGRAAQFETDTYAMLSLAYLLHRHQAKIWPPTHDGSLQESLAGAWTSPMAELAVARSPEAFASFAWRSVGDRAAPRGAFVPAWGDDLAEWGPDQLVGSFDLEGFDRSRSMTHRERTTLGGIVSTGRIEEGRKEGRPGLFHHVAFAALPAERFAVVVDLAIAVQEVTVTRDEGLQLAIPNDLWNGNRRTLTSELGELKIGGVEPEAASETRTLASRWVNVDGRLGVVLAYGQEPFTLRNFSSRDQRPTDPFRSLLAEMLETPYRVQPAEYRPRQVVRDTCLLLIAGDVAATRRASQRVAVAPTGEEMVRALWVPGDGGKRYLVVANFSDRERTVTLRPPGGGRSQESRVPPLDTLVTVR